MGKHHIIRPQPPWRPRPEPARGWCGRGTDLIDAGDLPELPTAQRFSAGPAHICSNCWGPAVVHARRQRWPLLAALEAATYSDAARAQVERELSTLVTLAKAHWPEYSEAVELEQALAVLAGDIKPPPIARRTPAPATPPRLL